MIYKNRILGLQTRSFLNSGEVNRDVILENINENESGMLQGLDIYITKSMKKGKLERVGNIRLLI